MVTKIPVAAIAILTCDSLLLSLEAPILIQPDTDWSSLDGLSIEPEAWLEVPLKSERPLPFQCAVSCYISALFLNTFF
jgi:hypothetical protein